MKDVKLKTTELEISHIIECARKYALFYIVITLIFIFWYGFHLISNHFLVDGMDNEMYWFVGLFLSFLVLIIGQIGYWIYTSKIYKILIDSKIKELPAKDISGRGWLVPFLNFDKPYKILNDIYKYANAKVGKNDKILSCTRRISILTPFLLSLIYSLIFFLTIDPIMFYIYLSWILTLPITIRLRKLYKLYQENQKEN